MLYAISARDDSDLQRTWCMSTDFIFCVTTCVPLPCAVHSCSADGRLHRHACGTGLTITICMRCNLSLWVGS